MGLRVEHFSKARDGFDWSSLLAHMDTEGVYQRFKPIINHSDVFADLPFPCIAEHLIKHHAQETFVLILRDPQRWAASVRTHTKGRDLHTFEKFQYWGITGKIVRSLNALSDEELIRAYQFHTGKCISHALRHNANLVILDLESPNLATRLQQITGIQLQNSFPNIDYRRGDSWRRA